MMKSKLENNAYDIHVYLSISIIYIGMCISLLYHCHIVLVTIVIYLYAVQPLVAHVYLSNKKILKS